MSLTSLMMGADRRELATRHHLVVLAVDQQRRDVEALEVLREVGLAQTPDALVGVLEAGLHAPPPELVEHALRDAGVGPVRAVELGREVRVELGPVSDQSSEEAVDQLVGQAVGVRVGPGQPRGNGGDQDRLGDA